MVLAERLVFVRERMRLSVKAGADRCGFPLQRLVDFESGQRGNPTIATLSKIANGYQMTLSELLDGVVYEKDDEQG